MLYTLCGYKLSCIYIGLHLHILVIKIYELEYSVSRHSVLTVHLTWYCTCHTSVLAELLQRYVAQIKPTMHWSLKSYRISFIYCYRCFEFRWYYPDYLTGFGISIYLSVSTVLSTYIRYLHSTAEISNVMRVSFLTFGCGWIGNLCCEVEYSDKKRTYLETGEVSDASIMIHRQEKVLDRWRP